MVMGKDSGTKCSHCGKNGHNSRTCTEKTVRLFGVKISSSPPCKREDPMKKSRSLGNLHTIDMQDDDGDQDLIGRGYLSDGPVRSKKDGHERKKGVPWTAEEHRTFLEGLKKLGKGDWRGISRNYVTTRTPAQVASHAQKYFIRQAAATKKKRRSSLFDMEISEPSETTESNPPPSTEIEKFPKQTGMSIVNQFNALGMHSSPPPPTPSLTRTRSFPSFSGGIPYMAGAPRGNMGYLKTEGFQTVSMVNICNVGYGYQPRPCLAATHLLCLGHT